MKVLLILLILFFYGGGRTFASDYWLNIFEERDKANNGNGISNSADSAALAWGESYWLQSYMIMYKRYVDTWTARL